MAEPDSRNSLRHILADEPAEKTPKIVKHVSPPASTSSNHVQNRDELEDDGREAETPHYTSTTQTTRRNANGSVSSVYSGNKIKHLKKEDGIPLWRKDIQYEFLQLVFGNEQRVFTRYSDKTKGHTFADIYIDAMAKSSKTSKILKEKLAQDHPSAVSMAMVCLLVNVGRMNTTLNFFPEMRAQLRTYHAIPALQAHQDPNAYKQLQDAPRLKSILKGASEDEPQPGDIDNIKKASVPRTNPVNLIFVLAQYAPKISEVHFTAPRDFFDLVMRPTLSSKSRANAFLWLIWWYLESDFSGEDSLRNPFGPGTEGENSGGLPVKVPQLEVLTEDQAALENVDTDEELAFGEIKRKERIAIVASEPSPAMTALKRARKERSLQTGFSYQPSDNEGSFTPSRDFQSPAPQSSTYSNPHRDYASSGHTRSPSPIGGGFPAVNLAPKPAGMSIGNMLGVEATPSRATPTATVVPPEKKKGPGRGNWRRNKEKVTAHIEPQPILPHGAQFTFVQGSPSQAPSFTSYPTKLSPEASLHSTAADNHIPTTSNQTQKRSRPLTQHQVAISEYRRSRIQHIIDRGLRQTHTKARRKRDEEGCLVRAWKRIRMMPSGWDSEEEEIRFEKDGDKRDDEGGNKTIDEINIRTIKIGNKEGAKTLHRSVGGVWMAGFVMPSLHEADDAGEQFGHLSRTMTYARQKFHNIDAALQGEIRQPKMIRRPISVPEVEEVEVDPVQVVGERPRLVRRTGGGRKGKKEKGKSGQASGKGRSRKSNASAATGDGMKLEDAADDDEGIADDLEGLDGEGDDMDMEDVGDGADGELDEEDRELLGQVDADESDDEGKASGSDDEQAAGVEGQDDEDSDSDDEDEMDET